MRFDDSLATVLATDTATSFGAQSAWRQLVDLSGRRRVPDIAAAAARLRTLRDQVPASVRAASGRALAWGEPPAALVALFAEDEPTVAAPVLRTARLAADEWIALLPRLSPATRSVLRHRRDLPAAVVRGLASFGATDFVLGHDAPAPVEPLPTSAPAPVAEPAPLAPTPFVAVGEIARGLPVVAEAMRRATDPEPPRFEIADLVARIAAFRQEKAAPAPVAAAAPTPEQFRFETGASGIIAWVDGVARGPLIGVTLARGGAQGVVEVDPAAGVALRARGGFRDLTLTVGGDSSAAGAWRLSGVPRFDRAGGRFTGLAGTARRPRDEAAAPRTTASDSLRQLIHELRTPINAIAGFSELIGTEPLGPVPPVYRDRAVLIERQAVGLAAAIDDLDTAARLEGDALDLRPGALDLGPMLDRAVADLRPLAAERRVTLTASGTPGAVVHADDRAATRLVERLLAVALSVAEPGERLHAHLVVKTRSVRLHLTRPRALKTSADDALLLIDAEAPRDDSPLLGTGFTLRLLHNLATVLGGSLAITPDRLTLRLPTAETTEMERATQE